MIEDSLAHALRELEKSKTIDVVSKRKIGGEASGSGGEVLPKLDTPISKEKRRNERREMENPEYAVLSTGTSLQEDKENCGNDDHDEWYCI